MLSRCLLSPALQLDLAVPTEKSERRNENSSDRRSKGTAVSALVYWFR